MLITTLITVALSIATSVQAERTVDVFAWPLSSTQAQPLASISYNAANATVLKYTPPAIPTGEDVVRIGFYGLGSWSGVATAASNLVPDKGKRVQLYINTNGELFHIGFKALDQTSSKAGKSKDGLEVEVIPTQKGPAPVVNKPVVLNSEGQVEQKEPEKTFLQKYEILAVHELLFPGKLANT